MPAPTGLPPCRRGGEEVPDCPDADDACPFALVTSQDWQRRHLRRLDGAQEVPLAWGLAATESAPCSAGSTSPESTGRLLPAQRELSTWPRSALADPWTSPGPLAIRAWGDPCARPRVGRTGRSRTTSGNDPGVAPAWSRRHQYGLPSSMGGSARVERFSNRVRFLRKVSLTLPVGPLRFLATMTSARPGWSLTS